MFYHLKSIQLPRSELLYSTEIFKLNMRTCMINVLAVYLFFLRNITSFSLKMHCFIVNFIILKVILGKRLMATPSSCRGSSQSLDTTESSDIVGTPHGLGKTLHHSGLEVDRPLINGGVFVERYPFKYYVHEIQIFMEKNNHITISLEYTVLT